jgi:hypothetical protein
LSNVVSHRPQDGPPRSLEPDPNTNIASGTDKPFERDVARNQYVGLGSEPSVHSRLADRYGPVRYLGLERDDASYGKRCCQRSCSPPASMAMYETAGGQPPERGPHPREAPPLQVGLGARAHLRQEMKQAKFVFHEGRP